MLSTCLGKFFFDLFFVFDYIEFKCGSIVDFVLVTGV